MLATSITTYDRKTGEKLGEKIIPTAEQTNEDEYWVPLVELLCASLRAEMEAGKL